MQLTIIGSVFAHLHKVYMFHGRFGVPEGFVSGQYAMARETDGMECLVLPNGFDPHTGRGMFDRSMLDNGGIGLTYPSPRVFVFVQDDRGHALPHATALKVLAAGRFSKASEWYWRNKLLLRGYAQGKPLFDNALMSKVDCGLSWVDVVSFVPPDSWEQWDNRSHSGGGYKLFWMEDHDESSVEPAPGD